MEPRRDARGVALAEVEPQAETRHRTAPPRQQIAAGGEDVAVVRRHPPDVLAGRHAAKASPHSAPLTVLARVQLRVFQRLKQALHPRPVVPQQRGLLRQLTEDLPGLSPVARARGTVEAHADRLEMTPAAQFAADGPQRVGAPLAHPARAHPRQGGLLGKHLQAPFHPVKVRRAQPMQRGNGAGLEKICHHIRRAAAARQHTPWPETEATAERATRQSGAHLGLSPGRWRCGGERRPASVAPDGFQAERRSIARRTSELVGPFAPARRQPTGRFHRPAA